MQLGLAVEAFARAARGRAHEPAFVPVARRRHRDAELRGRLSDGPHPGGPSATVNAARQTGTALGVAALGALLADGANLAAGLHAAMAVAGGVLLVVTVLTATTLRGA
nr:hypothetical protein [Amycolatopsis sp. DSM 110486]